MIGFGSFKGDTFVRLVTINGTNTEKDILSFFEELEKEADLMANVAVPRI